MKRMRTSSIFTALLLLLGYRVSAQNVCLNPGPSGDSADFSDNVVYPLGSVIDLSWKTSYPEVSLAIWQQNLDYEAASMFPLFNKKTGIYSYQWTVGLGGTGFNLDDSNVFYFSIYNGDIYSETLFTCHYFNVSSSGTPTTQSVVTATIYPSAAIGSDSSSSIAPPQTLTLTITPDITGQAALVSNTAITSRVVSSPTTETTASHATTTTSSSNNAGGLSSSAKVGIGVGVGVGVGCLMLGGAIGFFIRRRSNRRNKGGYEAPSQEPRQEWDAPPPTFASTEYNTAEKRQHQDWPPGELPVDEHPQELRAGQGQVHELPGRE